LRQTVEAGGRSQPHTKSLPFARKKATRSRRFSKGHYKGRSFAYALTGTIFNEGKTFNLITEAGSIEKALSSMRLENLYEYLAEFSKRIHRAFADARKDGRLEEFSGNPLCEDPLEKNTIARIIFAGYFRKGTASVARATFCHDAGNLSEPHIATETPPRQAFFIGAEKIAELVFAGNNAHFSQYRREADFNSSLEDAVRCARGFIEACCDPQASQIDKACLGIGGAIHIATVTPQQGFQWVIPPHTK
jgi:hypothetical protein